VVGPTWSPGPAARVHSVLFACSENAVRSPMAAALAEQRFGRLLHVESVGVRPGERNEFVTSVMAEVGIDLSHHRPRTFEDLEDTCFDLIVTLSPEAHHRALEFTRTMAVEVLYWPTLDSTGIEGSRAALLDAFRSVRDTLARRVSAALGLDAGGSGDPLG
jgi:protein-tyrosine-phosphatase